MTATDITLRPAAHPGRLRMLNHLRRLAAAGLVEPPCARQQHRAGDGGPTEHAEHTDAEDAEVWDDFRHRLAALLVGLHEDARAPRVPAPRTVQVGATVMAFPLNR
ncbi:hypothetical protein ACFWVC_18445 [Streptomyces sp. NPDC058691]|uniref:hypothetical protein n=1 Tax=Streptomyces sp. NPDC058691 TaxID=3346601 RepID=UPI003650F02E